MRSYKAAILGSLFVLLVILPSVLAATHVISWPTGTQVNYGSNTLIDTSGNLNVNKIIAIGTAPTVAVGSGSGIGASATITGHDQSCQVNLTLGTVVGAGLLYTVTYGTAPSTTPQAVTISALNSAAGGIQAGGTGLYVIPSSTGFAVWSALSGAGLSGVPSFMHTTVQ